MLWPFPSQICSASWRLHLVPPARSVALDSKLKNTQRAEASGPAVVLVPHAEQPLYHAWRHRCLGLSIMASSSHLCFSLVAGGTAWLAQQATMLDSETVGRRSPTVISFANSVACFFSFSRSQLLTKKSLVFCRSLASRLYVCEQLKPLPSSARPGFVVARALPVSELFARGMGPSNRRAFRSRVQQIDCRGEASSILFDTAAKPRLVANPPMQCYAGSAPLLVMMFELSTRVSVLGCQDAYEEEGAARAGLPISPWPRVSVLLCKVDSLYG
jgi:hypothetical protein